MTYQTLLRDAVNDMTYAGVPDASVDAWLLLERASGLSFAAYQADSEIEATPEIEALYKKLVKERISRKPVQLILGETDFMGLTFHLDGKELIPRQDTEVLVESVLSYAKAAPGLTVIDVFTGSGCIATSLAKLGNFSKVCGGDISEDAIKNAQANAERIGAGAIFRQGDMFEPYAGEKFDIVTANPPYIRTSELKNLMIEVRDYDPVLALDGGADGLIFYRRLALSARAHLNPEGAVFAEIGYDQAAQVSSIFAAAGYKDIRIIKDYGHNDRVLYARI